METKSNKKSKKSQKALEDYAFEASIALNAYRRSLCLEFFKLDPLDPDYDSFRTLYYELNDLYSGILNYLDENPDPFENVL